MADALSIKFDAIGVNAGLDNLAASITAQMRPAAQAGAQVLYEEVKLRAPIAKRERKTKKGRVIKPGALRDSIYQVYSVDNSTPERATYHVSWNYRKAPHGHLVEFGTSRASAHPFLRPSYDAKVGEALETARRALIDGVKT